jgi:hypothetical protein
LFNKMLHLTGVPLRSVAAGEFCAIVVIEGSDPLLSKIICPSEFSLRECCGSDGFGSRTRLSWLLSKVTWRRALLAEALGSAGIKRTAQAGFSV